MNEESKKFIDECADLAKRYSALYEELSGLVSVGSEECPSVHLMDDCFLNCFGDSFEAVKRKDSQFPWKLVHMENGVKFFCISSENPKE